MTRTAFWSPLLLAVALSPAFLQSNCSPKSGNPDLVSLELEAGGLDRLIGFETDTLAYSIWLDGAATFIVRATAEDSNTAIGVWTPSGYVLLGNGSGESSFDTPQDGTAIVVETKSSGGIYKRFQIAINSPCSANECNDNNSCTSDVCNTAISTCEFAIAADGTACDYLSAGDGACTQGVCGPRVAQTKDITLACRDSVLGTDIPFLPVELTVNPNPIVSGQPFTAQISGSIPFPESLLDLAQLLGPVKRAAFEDVRVLAAVRSGAAGPAVVLTRPPIATTCAFYESSPGVPAPCSPNNDTGTPDTYGYYGNTDCLFFGGQPDPRDRCDQFYSAPIEEDCSVCDALPDSGFGVAKSTQCANNGFCIAGPVVVPLTSATASYVADAPPGEAVLFGLAEGGPPPEGGTTGATLNADDSWNLPEATIQPPTPSPIVQGLRATIASESIPARVGMECTMGIDTGSGPGTSTATQQASRSPDSDLIPFTIADVDDVVTSTIPMVCDDPMVILQQQGNAYPAAFELTVDPLSPAIAGQPFDAQLTGYASVSRLWIGLLGAQVQKVPHRVAILNGTVEVEVRSGASAASGAPVFLDVAPGSSHSCVLDVNGNFGSGAGPYPSCDPANDIPFTSTAWGLPENSDCLNAVAAPNNPCLPFVEFNLIDGTGDACTACTALGVEEDYLCGVAGYCLTLDSDGAWPLTSVVETYLADSFATEVLFGFSSSWTAASLNWAIQYDDDPLLVNGLLVSEFFCAMLEWQDFLGAAVPDEDLVSIPLVSANASCIDVADCPTAECVDYICDALTGICEIFTISPDGTACDAGIGPGSGTCQSASCELPQP